jgi:uncharacterized protein (DUF1501 family)
MTTMTSSRRAFLGGVARLSVLGGAAPFALNLAAVGAAAAQSGGDYRALVCVFLFGGNDSANTVIPYDPAAYAAYRDARASIARDRATLVPLAVEAGQPPLAVPPELASFAGHFNARRAAVIANVGPLVEPVTQARLTAGSAVLPAKLFSHNDQQSTWQANATEGAQFGWGGRIGDVVAAGNANQTFTCMSIAGNTVWLSGQASTQYQVSAGGAVAVEAIGRRSLFGSTRAPALLEQLIRQERVHLLERDYVALTRRSLGARVQLNAALASLGAIATPLPPENALAAQLRMVARTIAARDALGVRRQVFFVSAGGFDNHAFLRSSHPPLLKMIADALDSFYATTVELGVADQVTTFTASDFGRALLSNGDGSDHGWGAHHLVLGGAVRGGRVYGRFPTVAPGSADDAGNGRLIPTTAVDQYAATLARWMGVSAGGLADILPHLGRFPSGGLDFLA